MLQIQVKQEHLKRKISEGVQYDFDADLDIDTRSCVYLNKRNVLPKNYSSLELINIVESDGWFKISKNGSHLKFNHKVKTGIVVIPHPKKDIPTGTAHKILKMAGFKERRKKW